MGFFSKLFNRNKKNNGSLSKDSQSRTSRSGPIEHFSISELVIVTSPLGNVRDTILSEEVIRSCITAVLKNNLTKINNVIIDEMKAKFDFLSTGYNHNTERGYAAIVRDNSGEFLNSPRERRVLIGSASYVRRATTDFHPDLQRVVMQDLPVDSTLHLAAIDGIAYAAITVKREMR